MAKTAKHRHKNKKYTLPKPGASPGLVYTDEHSLESVIKLHTYHADYYKEEALPDLNNLKEAINDKKYTYWVDIKGFKTVELFERLSVDFNINKLVLEDITMTYQRPKYEEYDGYDFAVSRMLYMDSEQNLINEQLSFILTENVLFTFQDRYEDCLIPIRKRLEIGKGNIRIGGSSYLMYALMDIVVDEYFAILGFWSENLDAIEDRLLDKPDKTIMFDTQTIKRNLITLRRVAWPERDKMNDILRSESELIDVKTKLYLRDAYDHCIQVIDMVESLKEISASIIDMYLSIISNRMNEIMKVLTIISSIFIPLTFIAGIYGMNFSREDPVTGKVLPQNMPELYAAHGYLYTMIGMSIIAVLQVIYFWRKGWFK
ncbi:magnesium/cobalt transporter CorA [Pedobacter changchengzhani]|uniref:Magnesium transport protein CorA n=1 Tax=Pedobacter changchengzhani TaxID=2529274 RepID=A0A4R5MJC0_9SPHI|nr:magnesium/cobalt transporter CorA [Pedobacter changchengzhani]TDG35671.1 magnesium/cobalt transporter CorA [Pedobacter changchengzhani]